MNNIALITGVTGQDGSYLAEFLLEQGYEFVTISDLFEKKGVKPEIHKGLIYSDVDHPFHYTQKDQ